MKTHFPKGSTGKFLSAITTSTDGHYMEYTYGASGHSTHFVVDVDLDS